MAWKLTKLAVRNGMSLSQMAKLIVESEIGVMTETEAREFFIEVERPRQRQEHAQGAARVAEKISSASPTMVEPAPTPVGDPFDEPLFDSNGWPLCPECRESSMLDDGVIVRSV